MKASVTVEGNAVLVDLHGPYTTAFTLTVAEAREFAQALFEAAWSTIKPAADHEATTRPSPNL